jgi:hypothetical protein
LSVSITRRPHHAADTGRPLTAVCTARVANTMLVAVTAFGGTYRQGMRADVDMRRKLA